MTAATAERYQTRRDGKSNSDPVAAGVRIFAGTHVVLDAAGKAKPGVTGVGLTSRGIAAFTADNRDGADGDLKIETRPGLALLANSAGGDQITAADIGKLAYVVDDQTVAKTHANGTRSPAGVIEAVESDGMVWLWVGIRQSKPGAGLDKVFVPVTIETLVGANTYRAVAPAAGRVTKIWSITEGVLTTGDATLTPKINGVDMTDGLITIAQAGSAAGDIDSSAPSAANTVAVGDGLAFLVGGTNATATKARLLVEITL